jgi:hypothetical protein
MTIKFSLFTILIHFTYKLFYLFYLQTETYDIIKT